MPIASWPVQRRSSPLSARDTLPAAALEAGDDGMPVSVLPLALVDISETVPVAVREMP